MKNFLLRSPTLATLFICQQGTCDNNLGKLKCFQHIGGSNMTRSGQERTGGPKILLIGGPEDASSSGVTRIGADFGSVMMGPPLKDYDDFDIIVVWPDQTTFLLPETHAAWEDFRAKHGNNSCLPSINPQYWNFRQQTEHRQLYLPDFPGVVSQSCVAQERLHVGVLRGLADDITLSGLEDPLFDDCQNAADALLLEKILWWKCNVRLRTAVLAMTTSTILLLFIPDLEFDVPWLSWWLCAYIAKAPEYRAPRRQPLQQRKLTPGSLEALANAFATEARGETGHLSLQREDPQCSEPPDPMDGQYALGPLLLHPEDFTIPGDSENMLCHSGWGFSAHIAVWPAARNPLAILLECKNGGAVVLPSAPPADRLLSLLRRWYRERTDPNATSDDQRWSKNIFRLDNNRGVWVCKIAEEGPVELPDNLKGCGYYHQLLDQANWAVGIPYEEMHYGADLSNINKDGILEEEKKRAKAPKTKQENAARASVRKALNRVCDELRKRGAPKLADHLSPKNSIKEEVPSFIYTGQLNWERD
jgi:hypothetical protein